MGDPESGEIRRPPLRPPRAMRVSEYSGLESPVGNMRLSHRSDEESREPPPPEFEELNYVETFRTMNIRRLKRQLGGYIENRNSRFFLILLAFVLQAMGWANITIRENQTNSSSAETQPGGLSIGFSLELNEDIAVLVLGGIILFVAVQVAEIVRPAIYFVVLGLLAFIITEVTCVRERGNPDVADFCQQSRYIVTYATLGCIMATGALWLATNKLYPFMMRRAMFPFNKVAFWWGIEQLGPHRPSQYRYWPSMWWAAAPCASRISNWLSIAPRHFGYDGDLDEEGRPDGFGTWNDSAKNGETLYGVWEHGEPIGPFRATEYASGYVFEAVRIAYVHNRMEPLYDYWYRPQRNPQGLMWGVVSVECSVSGHFFKHLPAIREITEPEPNRNAAWCISHLRTGAIRNLQNPLDTMDGFPATLVVTAGRGGVTISGYEPPPGGDPGRVVIDFVSVEDVEGVERDSRGSERGWEEPSRRAGAEEESLLLDESSHVGGTPTAQGAAAAERVVAARGEISSRSRDDSWARGSSVTAVRSPSRGRCPNRVAINRVATATSDVVIEMDSLTQDEGATPSTPHRAKARHPRPPGRSFNELSGRRRSTTCSLRNSSYRTSFSRNSRTDPTSPRLERSAEDGGPQNSPSGGGPDGPGPGEAEVEQTWGSGPQSGLRVVGADGTPWTSNLDANYEAVVFLHGFNSPVSDALKRIGQLWTLGDFPAHLIPFVFGWPAARDLTYFSAKRMAMEDDEMAADFAAFVSSLHEAGCRQLHVIAHSMGAMLLFQALPRLAEIIEPLTDVRTSKARSDTTGAPIAAGIPPPADSSLRGSMASSSSSDAACPRKLRLATTILMHPDAELDRFINKDFPALRRLCDHITLYGDTSDGALWYSEIFNRWKSLGRHPHELVRFEDASIPAAAPEPQGTPPSPVRRCCHSGPLAACPSASVAARPSKVMVAHASVHQSSCSCSAAPEVGGAEDDAPPPFGHSSNGSSSNGPTTNGPSNGRMLSAVLEGSIERSDSGYGSCTELAAAAAEMVDAQPDTQPDAPPGTLLGTLPLSSRVKSVTLPASPGRSSAEPTGAPAGLAASKTSTAPRASKHGVDEAETISKAHRISQKKSPAGKRPVPLDIDVIDVSWMDNNVHSMRHNYFNINRWMIDDLREIVSTKRRARLRTARMTRRFANVWSFLAAPRHIVNP